MYLLTVDLASKFSAAMLRDSSGRVRWQGDSSTLSPSQWVSALGEVSRRVNSLEVPLHILIEDVPYGISSQAMVKPVLRLQGMLMQEIEGEIFFINPSTWQKDYPGVGRAPKGMTKADGARYRVEKAREYASALGYEAPNLVEKWQKDNPDLKPLKKYTAPLEKNMTDYVDAFLMNDWLQRHIADYKTTSGVQVAMI